jgi:preprotein translocase SecE subunit
MHSRQRYVYFGVIALAAIVGMAFSHGLQWVWTEANLTDPLPLGTPELPLTTLLGYGIALAGAVFVFRHGPTHALAVEIVDELARVTWPSREETGNATVVVIVTVLVCSAYLGMFDAIWLWVTDMILGVRVATPG